MAQAAEAVVIDKPIAVVTGVSSGIGRSMVKSLINKGYFVAGCARRQEKIDELSNEYDSKCGDFSVVDVTNPEQVKNWCTKIGEELGIPRLIVANAGTSAPSSIPNATNEDFDKIFNVNVRGVFLLIKYLLPFMLKEENKDNKCGIFGISSAAGRQGLGKLSLYCASKWAVEGFFASLAKEIEGSNIMAASYDPGAVSTGMSAQMPNVKEWITSDEEAEAAINQFIEKMENPSENNGKPLTTTLINDERQGTAFNGMLSMMPHIP